jgi:DNA-directed RNA polymerase specialized sigma24 family protein
LDDVEAFTGFVEEIEPRLRVSLLAGLGVERGREATAEALAYAWEHWERVRGLEFPVAYLYRVGRSRTRGRKTPVLRSDGFHVDSDVVEPELGSALDALSKNQRMAVVLVHAFGWTHREAGELMNVKEPTVKTHVQRGLAKLRGALGVASDV